MNNSVNSGEFPKAVMLTVGNIDEISTALRSLGAPEEILAKASVSFLVKIPGATVERVRGGFKIGSSMLPYIQGVGAAAGKVQERFQGVMVHSANDTKMLARA